MSGLLSFGRGGRAHWRFITSSKRPGSWPSASSSTRTPSSGSACSERAAGAYATQLFARVWLPMLATYILGIGVAARLFHDVAEHMRLVDARARFRAIMDDASDAIRVVDSKTMRILDVNHADCEISGYSRKELIGRDARDFWPSEPELRAKRQATVAAARATGYARGY